MFDDVQLSESEKERVAKVAGSFIGKLCFGGAVALKGVGFAIDQSTGLTATGLRIAADGIETVGAVGSGFCYTNSEKLKAKADEYDLSDIGSSKPEGREAKEDDSDDGVIHCEVEVGENFSFA